MNDECESLGRLMAGLLRPSRNPTPAPKIDRCWMSNGTYSKVAEGKWDRERLAARGYKEVTREEAIRVTRARLAAQGQKL